MTKATSFRDPFVRPSGGAQAGASSGAVTGAFAMASDQFREAAAGKAAKMFAARPDAFAAKKAVGPAPNAIPNPFDPAPREAAMRPEKVAPVAPPAASPKVRVLKNGASLKVVQPGAESMDDIRAEFEEKVRRSNPVRARFASLATAMMATGAAAGAATAGSRGGSAETTDSRGRARSGGGGGGREPPKIDRAFNQDDLMAVLIVLALLLMLGIYFLRGNGAPQTLASTQLAASEKVLQPQAAPAAPPAPLKDPYGDQPLDLTPKAAPPAEVQVAPTPAPAPTPVTSCKAGHTMRAFFCTDRAELTDNSKVALEKELADWTSCFKDRELVVTGYADTRGPAVYNTYLGETRAKSVADFLRSRGIKVAQLTGVGELDGLADNENCANQRRVDISFAGEGGDAPSRSCAPPEDLAALVCG